MKFRKERYIVVRIKRCLWGGVHYFGGNQYYHDLKALKLFKRKRKALKYLKELRNKPHFFSIHYEIKERMIKR